MRYLLMTLLTVSALHSNCHAVELSPQDLGGIWKTELAGFIYTFGIDPRDPQKVIMVLGTKAKGVAAEDVESGTLEITGGPKLRFRVIGADNKERRVREYSVTELAGDVLTLTWDNPPVEGVKLRRIQRDLQPRE